MSSVKPNYGSILQKKKHLTGLSKTIGLQCSQRNDEPVPSQLLRQILLNVHNARKSISVSLLVEPCGNDTSLFLLDWHFRNESTVSQGPALFVEFLAAIYCRLQRCIVLFL